MAIKCINFGTPTTTDELNTALNEGYKFQFLAGVVMWLHKPDAPKISADMHVSIGNPDAFLGIVDKLMRESSIGDSIREVPSGTSYNDWYGVRDIP
jgi:hypothetical protein